MSAKDGPAKRQCSGHACAEPVKRVMRPVIETLPRRCSLAGRGTSLNRSDRRTYLRLHRQVSRHLAGKACKMCPAISRVKHAEGRRKGSEWRKLREHGKDAQASHRFLLRVALATEGCGTGESRRRMPARSRALVSERLQFWHTRHDSLRDRLARLASAHGWGSHWRELTPLRGAAWPFASALYAQLKAFNGSLALT